jgi:PTS system galactitol-specific IIA component
MTSSTANSKFETSEALTLFNVSAESRNEVIETLANLFDKYGFVHEAYLDAVLEREKTMPTGLMTKAGGIAIPHTDVEHVKKSGIAIARMKSPVKFYNMGNPTEQVDVNIVFLLAIAEKEQVNPFLRKMAELLQNEPAFLKLLAIDNSKDFVEYFSSMIVIDENLC